jgi:hypothetical protein
MLRSQIRNSRRYISNPGLKVPVPHLIPVTTPVQPSANSASRITNGLKHVPFFPSGTFFSTIRNEVPQAIWALGLLAVIMGWPFAIKYFMKYPDDTSFAKIVDGEVVVDIPQTSARLDAPEDDE